MNLQNGPLGNAVLAAGAVACTVVCAVAPAFGVHTVGTPIHLSGPCSGLKQLPVWVPLDGCFEGSLVATRYFRSVGGPPA